MPGERDSHVNDRPGTTSVTVHVAVGKPGCLTLALLPTAVASPRIHSTLVMDAVQLDHVVGSPIRAQTRSGGASTVKVSEMCMHSVYHAVHANTSAGAGDASATARPRGRL